MSIQVQSAHFQFEQKVQGILEYAEDMLIHKRGMRREEDFAAFCIRLKGEPQDLVNSVISKLWDGLFSEDANIRDNASTLCSMIVFSEKGLGKGAKAILEELEKSLFSESPFHQELQTLFRRFGEKDDGASKEAAQVLSKAIHHKEESIRMKALAYSEYLVVYNYCSQEDVQALISIASDAMQSPEYHQEAHEFFDLQIKHRKNESAYAAAYKAIQQAVGSKHDGVVKYALNLLGYVLVPRKDHNEEIALFTANLLENARRTLPVNSVIHRGAVNVFGELEGADIEKYLPMLMETAKEMLYSKDVGDTSTEGYHFFIAAIEKRNEIISKAVAGIIDEALQSKDPKEKAYGQRLKNTLRKWF